MVASAPLTPFLKLGGGIHPIAVGTIWRRLVSKVAMKGVGKDMARYLNDIQFGVEVSGWVEVILHSVNRVLNLRHGDGSLTMLTVDFSNVFNLVDRSALLREVRLRCPSISLWVEFLYGQAARLYVGDGHRGVCGAIRLGYEAKLEPIQKIKYVWFGLVRLVLKNIFKPIRSNLTRFNLDRFSVI